MNRRQFLIRSLIAGAGIALPSLAGRFVPFAEAMEITKFSFVHITDLHLDVRGESTWQYRAKSIPLFIDTLRQIGRLPKLDFILFGGDQIHPGPRDRESLRVFQEWMSQVDVPYYVLLGNAEVSPVPGVSTLGREYYQRVWSSRGPRPGNASWAFDPVRGVRFIGLDVTVDGKPYGEASPKTLRWLERELAQNRAKKLIIIATHQLLYPTAPLDLTPAWSLWMVRNHLQVREIIERYPNVRLVVSGHHHASNVQTVGNVTYVADPSVVTYPCAFRVFTVTKKGIHLQNIGMDDKAAVTRARELLLGDPYARVYDYANPEAALTYSVGFTEQDREAFLPL